MNCRNCGAAMELFERRKYFYCRYCGTFHFIETTETDGVQVLERSGDAPCPVCSAQLAKALLDDRQPVHYCEQCRGVLVPRSVFADVIDTRRASATGPPVTPSPLDTRELQRRVVCPQCRQKMDVHPYYGPGNIVIDTCPRCDVIWLDFGELKQVADAPGKDRRQRAAPPARPVEEPRESLRGPRRVAAERRGPLLDALEDLLS
jgi:Zn-finger nucleic acid-binding protein